MALFERTLAAFADTIIPPDDGPGGSEVGSLRLYKDPFYRARAALPVVGLHLNLHALLRRGRTFPRLDREGRTAVVVACERSPLLGEAYQGLIMLTKLAFYGGIFSPSGHDYINYPGPNEGYPEPEDAPSFETETTNGNLP